LLEKPAISGRRTLLSHKPTTSTLPAVDSVNRI
jgi:hypothetical protein